jgi:hypothetical protein
MSWSSWFHEAMYERGIATCLVVTLTWSCSGDDTVPDGTDGASMASDGPGGSTGAMDAPSERAAGDSGGVDSSGGAGAIDGGSTTADAPDSSPAEEPDVTLADVAADAAADIAADTTLDAPTPDADAMSCTTHPAPNDASAEPTKPGTITNLTGYTASDVLYVTYREQAGAVPRDRFLELRFDPSPGVCSATLAGQRKASGSQLQISVLRANYLLWGTLPDFFVPGTYPLSENVYESDAGIASVADINLVTTDVACRQTFTTATSGSLTLTSVTPGHVAGSFTATFDDAGTISGGFDVDLCFDAEPPECPYACVP